MTRKLTNGSSGVYHGLAGDELCVQSKAKSIGREQYASSGFSLWVGELDEAGEELYASPGFSLGVGLGGAADDIITSSPVTAGSSFSSSNS
jgi:hypothetical protein